MIGKMRETLVLLRRTPTTDSHGGRSVAFSTLDTVPAELFTDDRGEETVQVQQVVAQVDRRFRIRVRTDITPGMRAFWRPSWSALSTPKTLEIHSALEEGDGRTYMILKCGEVAA